MKVSELRLGNYILHNGEAVPIVQIERRYKTMSRLNDIDIDERIIEDHFQPIPLTPEWLEKFGFEWEDGFMKISIGYAKMKLGFYAGVADKMTLFQTTIPGEGSREIQVGFGENHPDHVHELQNLFFALSGGKELIINHEHLQITS